MFKLRSHAFVLALCALAASSEAALIQYSDRPTWLTAVGPLSGVEDFNAFGVDAQFRTATVALNNMNVSGGTGPNGTVTNKIDASPFEFGGFFSDGTPYLLGDLVSGVTMRVDFLSAITAWGADIQGIADAGRPTRIDVFDSFDALLGSVTLASLNQSEDQFYGFQLTGGDLAHYMIFVNSSTNNDTFGIDNIGFVSPAPVPEPGSLVLFAIGGLLLALHRRRSQA